MRTAFLAVLVALTDMTTSEAREIEFAGLTWQVKSGFMGPGPNHWSDDARSVWVDAAGNLHLKIRRIKGKWHCAEIFSNDSFGHGNYRFEVSTNVERMDANVVLGLFTYLDDTNEIDIEMARWGDPSAPSGNYAVQPYYLAGNQRAFELGLNGDYSTHRFRWLPDQIEFESLHGHYPTAPTPAHQIQSWTYQGANVPAAGAERLHLNLWLFQGQAPTNKQEVEVVIKRVVVEPPLHLTASLDASSVQFAVDGGRAGDPVVLWSAEGQALASGTFDPAGQWSCAWAVPSALTGLAPSFRATTLYGATTLASQTVTLALP